MKVLVIEDELEVSTFIKQGLEEFKLDVEVAHDGTSGQAMALANNYDVIVLDLVIPGIHGIDVCKAVKNEKPQTPILMLTTLGTTADKIYGFDAGADDYLLKPFEFAELTARIKALSRRGNLLAGNGSNVIWFDNLKLDLDKKVAERAGKTIRLSAKEFSLLEYFMKNQGRVISRAELADKIWNIKFETGTNVVEVYMNMLRNKIDREFDPKLLHTRIGLGYVLSNES